MNSRQRLVLVISILASTVAFLDGSIVNVALPAIQRSLGGGLVLQQWVVDAYAITLGALMLIAGSLSDLFGRKRILFWGLLGFLLASLVCAGAPTAAILIGARACQGVAGALLVPSSLALIISTFSGGAQGKAIGRWTAWTGIAFIFGPLLGGLLIDTVSWRLIFAINVLPILATLVLLRRLQLSEQKPKKVHVDGIGALLCGIGFGGPVFALIEQPRFGWSSPLVYLTLSIGVVVLASFFWYEGHTNYPMLPFRLFARRNFSVGNVATVAIYASLSVVTFLVVLFLQQVSEFSAFAAGLALLPITILMFLLSPRFGALAGKYGPRIFMSIGPVIVGGACLLMLRIGGHVDYWTQVFPAIAVFGLGLSMTVAPLTAAILGDVPAAQAGIASAVNNAVSRIAGLLAVAVVGALVAARFGAVLAGYIQTHHLIVARSTTHAIDVHPMNMQLPHGIQGGQLAHGVLIASVSAFHVCLIVTAGLLMIGGLISFVGIRNVRDQNV